MEWLNLVANTVPQFLFAIILFYLCQQNSDKQRDAYVKQIDRLYSLAERIIDRVDDVMALAREFREP